MIKIILIVLIPLFLPYSLYTYLTISILTLSLIALSLSFSQDTLLFYRVLLWDSAAINLIRLTILIIVLIILASLSNINIIKSKKTYIFILILLETTLIGTFRSSNFIIFYILFEASLIPTFILILGWGNQPERIQAGIYILIYTILASVPLLIILVIWSTINFSSNMIFITLFNEHSIVSYIMAILLITAFSVKLPIYILHLWLPKAHVEAPVAGSIILAAILLKLGGYGLLRVSIRAHRIIFNISPLILRWSLTGGVIAALICIFQTDIKFLIALSSVSHIALVIARLLTFSNWGINGAIFIIVGHGFCSSGLFFIANIIYERVNSRRLFIIKGLQTLLPSFSIVWFLICTSNIAAPPSLNLLGEINRIISLFSWSLILTPLLIISIFIAATYSLFLYSQSQHGKLISSNNPIKCISTREWLVALYHWSPLNLLILSPWVMQIIL